GPYYIFTGINHFVQPVNKCCFTTPWFSSSNDRFVKQKSRFSCFYGYIAELFVKSYCLIGVVRNYPLFIGKSGLHGRKYSICMVFYRLDLSCYSFGYCWHM